MKKVIAIIPHLGVGGAEELLVQQREWFRSIGIDFEIYAMFKSRDSDVMTFTGKGGPDVILSKGKRCIEDLNFLRKCFVLYITGQVRYVRKYKFVSQKFYENLYRLHVFYDGDTCSYT